MLHEASAYNSSTGLVVVTIPPITEDLSSSYNAAARQYNQGLIKLVQDFNRGRKGNEVKLVDFYSLCHSYITAKQQQQQHKAQEQQQPTQPLTVVRVLQLSMKCSFLRWVRWESWNAISSRLGLHLLVDNVHFNEFAADLLADAVALELQDMLVP
jgi:hypothetical protein